MPTPATTVPQSAVLAAHEVRVVLGRLRRRLREAHDGLELTPSQTSVLSRLDRDGPATTSELAVAERVRPQSVAATLAVLDERGLIARHPDPHDGRRVLISLTAAAREVVAGRRTEGEEWLARAMAERLTEAERRRLVDATALLDRVLER